MSLSLCASCTIYKCHLKKVHLMTVDAVCDKRLDIKH